MSASSETNGRLQRELSEQTAHLHMTTPVVDILDRGSALTRRRRRVAVGGLAVAGIVALAGASVVASPGTSPLVPQAQAAWGASSVNLPDGMLAEATRLCAPDLAAMGSTLPTTPVAADSRNGETIVIYRDDSAYTICDFMGDTAQELQLASVTHDDWSDLPADVHARFLSATYAQPQASAPLSDGAGALRVAEDVDRLVIDFDGRRWETAVVDGFALFWMPDGISEQAFREATVTAYDADGSELSTDLLADLPEQPSVG